MIFTDGIPTYAMVDEIILPRSIGGWVGPDNHQAHVSWDTKTQLYRIEFVDTRLSFPETPDYMSFLISPAGLGILASAIKIAPDAE